MIKHENMVLWLYICGLSYLLMLCLVGVKSERMGNEGRKRERKYEGKEGGKKWGWMEVST